jgi:hydroxymethylpyrimidine/phosphomethylpyrimidine kinase
MKFHVDRENNLSCPDGATRTPAGSSRRPVVLSIAGFDPSAGAGVTADLKVFAALGLYGMACITALTIQSTQGVRGIDAVAVKTVSETLSMLAEDVAFAGIKIGMLANGEVGEAVAAFLDERQQIPVVLDPVLQSSSGQRLIDLDGLDLIRRRLLPRVNWITPNLEELAILAGASVMSREDIPAAAAKLQLFSCETGNAGLNILVTGGHLPIPDDYLLSSGGVASWIPGERVSTSSTHGTGCALSSALLCRLVLGEDGHGAAVKAKEFVTGALRAAYPVGGGRGPMNHLFSFEAGIG